MSLVCQKNTAIRDECFRRRALIQYMAVFLFAITRGQHFTRRLSGLFRQASARWPTMSWIKLSLRMEYPAQQI